MAKGAEGRDWAGSGGKKRAGVGKNADFGGSGRPKSAAGIDGKKALNRRKNET